MRIFYLKSLKKENFKLKENIITLEKNIKLLEMENTRLHDEIFNETTSKLI